MGPPLHIYRRGSAALEAARRPPRRSSEGELAGGDATPDVGPHIDWGERVFTREAMQDRLYQVLAALFPDAPVQLIIAVEELTMIACTA